MDNIHNSIGPEVGSSRGKKKYAFSPTFLENSHLTNYNLVRLKKFYKPFHKSTFCFFIALLGILLILSNSASFQARTNPVWFGKIENSKFCDFSSKKTKNSKRFEIPKKSEALVRPRN